MVVFWLLFTLFASFIYDCNLRAYVLIKEYEAPIDTLQDVIGMSSKRQLWLLKGTGLRQGLKLSPFEAYQKVSGRVRIANPEAHLIRALVLAIQVLAILNYSNNVASGLIYFHGTQDILWVFSDAINVFFDVSFLVCKF